MAGGGEGWGGYGLRLTGDTRLSSPPTLSQLPHATGSTGATIHFHCKQWQTFKFTERPVQLFPVFVGVLPLGGYEWTQGPGVPTQQWWTLL